MQEIKIFNTLGKKKVTLVPLKSNHVNIYVCGVTVYDRCHLGHIRGAVNFDVIRKFLIHAGYTVTFVKNYTDIDDKIIVRANESGVSYQDLTNDMIDLHDKDMAAFGVTPADIAPKATEHIQEIIEMINGLIDKGIAYESQGDVYFRTEKCDGYGQLSGKTLSGLASGIRIQVSDLKERPYDFALWKFSKPGEPSWDSPWGPGRPGWHIECSAMCGKYLGNRFDIHGGGEDLIFPHHENEIAQSSCHFGCVPANIWMHNGLVEISGSKMSKSIGNTLNADEIISQFKPEVIRFYILKSHYRQPFNYDPERVADAADNLDRLYSVMLKYAKAYGDKLSDVLEKDYGVAGQKFHDGFLNTMRDDFNTPEALAWLFTEAKALNSGAIDTASDARLKSFYQACRVLGILNDDPETWFASPRQKLTQELLSEDQINTLIKERRQARDDKDWAKSDEIRDQLKEKGIGLKDKGNETTWYYL